MYRQDAFVCMQPPFPESNSCALRSLWKAKWRKEFIWFAILRAARRTSISKQTCALDWYCVWAQELVQHPKGVVEGVIVLGGQRRSSPSPSNSSPPAGWLTHPPACPPAVKPSRQWFLTFSASISLVPLRLSLLSKPAPAAHRWNSSKPVSTNPGSLVHLSER